MSGTNVFRIESRRCSKSDEHHGPYRVDSFLALVQCESCLEKMNPIQVLLELARHEGKWSARIERFRKELDHLTARAVCKCEHCGRVTRLVSE